jgi:BirA family biotin operon repressor/biotin-[acetyl-CoA-carboxylase] ligase
MPDMDLADSSASSGADAGYDAAELGRQLEHCTLATQVRLAGAVGSTNDVARELGRAGARHGAVVVAEQQTAGRGRRQRHWDSPGGGVYLSVLMRPPAGLEFAYATGVQLAAGIAIGETTGPALHDRVELVWPNDVYCRGQKLAGVLVEAESTGRGMDFLVCGIGVNVNQSADEFAPELRGQAGSIRSLSGAPFDRQRLVVRLLHTLESWEQVARSGDTKTLAARFEQMSPTSNGARIEVQTADAVVAGTSAGITGDGALRVRTADGVREVMVGELIRAWSRR